MKSVKIGIITREVIKVLEVNIEPESPIYIAGYNVAHMQTRHPRDFREYGNEIRKIISDPDYIGIASGKSIEYIKEYKHVPEGSVFVKVAVKASPQGTFYVCTMYRVKRNRVINFINKCTLKAVVDKEAVLS
ncbi:MAG: hypothetical protein LBG80_06400 [Bacteroidales bacterium]|nr:hypothetical protein [Bacteroidales bacterium]